MKALHVICQRDKKTNKLRGITPIDAKANQYVSCCWDFDLEEMRGLIGGMIFFHAVKSERSLRGGVVYDVCSIDLDSPNIGDYYTPVEDLKGKKSPRMMFKFEITKNGSGVKWRGSKFGMAYQGGIVDIDEPN